MNQQLLNSVLSYDKKTGRLKWIRPTSNRAKANSYADSRIRFGYRMTNVFGRRIASHRLIWMMEYGQFPTADLDHINRDRSDNRLSNLRPASRSENRCNSPSRNKECRPKNVYRLSNSSKFKVAVSMYGVQYHIGLFDTIEEASDVARHAVKYLHNEFAYTT